MHRATWKFPFIIPTYLDETLNVNMIIRNANRSMIISENLYKKKVGVYNGKHLIKFSIKNSMLGRKFGEFSITKTLVSLVVLKKKKKRKK